MKPAHVPRTVRQNLAVIIPLALFQTVVYVSLNRLRWLPARRLPVTVLDDWFPFWPWTVVPYLILLIGSLPVALKIRTDHVLRRAIVAYLLSLGITALFFVFWPTACARPESLPADGSWDVTAYRWLMEIDTPVCSFPSLHIILPAICCWAVCAEGQRWGWWVSAAALVLSLTILTTKQHYAWDWFGGLAVAALGIWLSGRICQKPDS